MAGLFTAIGSNISARLDQLRLSQTDLAEKIGVSKQVVNKIVQGKKAINAIELASIAAVLKCSVDELIQNAQAQTVADPFLLMMGNVSKSNTKEDLSFLYHMMDEMLRVEVLAR